VTAVGSLIQVSTAPRYTDADFIVSLTQLYTAARQHRGTVTNEWKRNFRLTMNKVAPALPAAAGVRANECYAIIADRIGWMTDQEVSCSITPAADPYSAWFLTQTMLASQLEQVINSVYTTDDWFIEIEKMLWDQALYGVGFLKAGWDQGKTKGMGNVVLRAVSPWCLYVDPVAHNLEDAEYIFEVHTMTPAEIERRYPSVSKRLIEAAMIAGDVSQTHVPPSQLEGGSGRRTDLIPINAGQGPTTWGPPGGTAQDPGTNYPYRAVNVYECWLKQNYLETVESPDPTKGKETVVVSEWRVVVYSGNRILLDEMASNLYHTNRHPYVRYVDIETGTFWGSPIVRDLGPCQVALNRLLALVQNNVEYTGNPIFVGVKGSGMDRSTFVNRPGRIYDVDGGPNSQNKKPEWLQPPNLPQILQWFIGFWRDEMERIAGLQGGQRGEIPSGRATDKQVAATQEAGFIRIRAAQRNLELALAKGFELVANLVVLNYDVPRTVAIVGPEGDMNSVKLSANHFYDPSSKDGPEPLRFSLLVGAGSTKPTSRAARMQEAVQLKQLGAVDAQYVLQAFRVSHWPQVLQRVQAEQQQEAMMEMQMHDKGGPHHEGPGSGTHEH
jgi:hypothetical protein